MSRLYRKLSDNIYNSAGTVQLPMAITYASSGDNNIDKSSLNKRANANKDRFPIKLYELLQKSTNDDGLEDIISWLPCGTAFKIHDQKKFEDIVMPNFFPGMTRYKSFRRQLNIRNPPK